MDLVDPALIRSGRFDYVVRFEVPEEKDRIEIFKIHAKDIGGSDLKRLARMTEGFVGSDIETVCKRARLAAMERRFSSGEKAAQVNPQVEMEDFQKALDEVKKRIGVGRAADNPEDELSGGRKTESRSTKDRR